MLQHSDKEESADCKGRIMNHRGTEYTEEEQEREEKKEPSATITPDLQLIIPRSPFPAPLDTLVKTPQHPLLAFLLVVAL